MKKKFILAGLFAASALIAACSDDEISNPQAVPDTQPVVSSQENIPETQGTHIVLHGVANGDAGLQKTMLASDGKSVLFSKGDKVSLFDGDGNNCELNSDVSDDGTTAEFSGTIKKDADSYYILYPYQSGASINNTNIGYSIHATLPCEQTATPNSFDPKANLSAAKCSDGNSFTLYNIGSLLKLTTTESFSKIVVRANNDEGIAGDCKITFIKKPMVLPGTNAVSMITLKPGDSDGDGDVDGDDVIEAGTYYVVLLYGTLQKGLTIDFYQKDASGTEIKTSDTYRRFEKELDFERCKGKNCGELLTANGVYIDMQKVNDKFSIGRYEVTQRLWNAVMGSDNNYSTTKGDDYPVDNVSFVEHDNNTNYVIDFLTALNNIIGNSEMVFRLPENDEWILAAKGGDPDNTNTYSGSNDISEVAWYNKDETFNNVYHEVGTLSPNELGIFDMSGNVWEWCNDDNDYYKPYRGGSVMSLSGSCQVTSSSKYMSRQGLSNIGFRLALSL